ncbi:AAA family ATPase [Oceanisphaera sp. IT1-181]|uniref:AAA family ATPase n=1 Tax=Oceanisphaera sp. IT1-181 TaxID=3081199 RepID=UPI0029CA0D50|nr:AAA family ATPase [Oceanisphaera sp. IT1-181]
MSKLESITLSNLRKFGPEVTIELSPGATILLAPNGTGKTTVFEAIEFGLTGKIARLRGDISHVIRDNEAAAKVSLDFANLTATSQVTSTGKVTQEGDLSAVFPGISATDIPFLLRLTHLLDQRENGWLVKAEEKDAGSQLARLPIGRDGSRARATLSTVRRSLTEQKAREVESLNVYEGDLNEWDGLIQERDIAAAGSIDALRPRDHIAKLISDAAAQTQSLDKIPPGLLTEPVGQEALSIAHSALSEILQTKAEHIRKQISGLTEVDNLVEAFGTAQTQLEKLNSELVSASEIFNAHEKKKAESAASIQQHQASVLLAQNQLIYVVQELERLVSKATARKQIDHRNEALTDAATAVRQAEEKFKALREQHERNQQVRNKHAQINDSLLLLAQSEQHLHEGQHSVIEWDATEERFRKNTQEINIRQKVLEHLNIELKEKLSAHETFKIAEATARANYQVLSSSADAIRQAVASIAEHLSSDQDNCPLCLESHGAVALQARVAKALQAIDPNLTSAEQQLRTAAEALAVSEAAVSSAREAIQACQTELTSLNTHSQMLDQKILVFRTDPILASDSVSMAKESLKLLLDGIAVDKQSLVDQQSVLELVVPEAFEQAKQAYDNAVRALDEARLHESEAAIRLDHAVTTLTTLTTGAPLLQTLEQLTTEKAQLDQRVSDLNGNVESLQSVLDTQQHQQLEFTSAIQRIEEEIDRTQSKLSLLRSRWQELALPGVPLAEVAQARFTELHIAMANLESYALKLEGVGVEISAWAKLNESHLAQRLIDAQRLERSEGAFSTLLNDRVINARTNLSRLSKLSEAMDTLDSSLKREIDNVQKHVGSVVPRWQTLLKRVVRDPRFHQTSLKLFSAYNKERAGVSVPLAGKSVAVPDVASEAQLTDLQLTFLLSMAMSHQWSPWKALLLDDPTQHHDLVHASAVFDVLRDYIVDHGFQVVIATHDALQARYFLRKLQNDGIDAKIWTLVPTEHGVSAEEDYGKQRVR